MKKRKTKKRIVSLEARFLKELKAQERFRLAQFRASSKEGKEELIYRAVYATTKFLKTARGLIC